MFSARHQGADPHAGLLAQRARLVPLINQRLQLNSDTL